MSRNAEFAGPSASSGTSAFDPAGVEQEALRRLRKSGYLAHHTVACKVHGTVIVLLGTLPSYYLKQLAQSIAAEVQRDLEVVNRIEVAAGAPASQVTSKQGRPPASS